MRLRSCLILVHSSTISFAFWHWHFSRLSEKYASLARSDRIWKYGSEPFKYGSRKAHLIKNQIPLHNQGGNIEYFVVNGFLKVLLKSFFIIRTKFALFSLVCEKTLSSSFSIDPPFMLKTFWYLGFKKHLHFVFWKKGSRVTILEKSTCNGWWWMKVMFLKFN